MINTALIGIGHWGTKLKKYIELNPNFNLKYIANSKFDKSIIWNDKRVNSVIIATPMETHYSIIKDALLHNKNVLCEKPITLKVKEALELKEIAEKKHLSILVDYTYTFSKALKKMKVIIEKGEMGNIRHIHLRLEKYGNFQKYGVYWLLSSHLLSILDMFIPLDSLKYQIIDPTQCGEKSKEAIILFEKNLISGEIISNMNCTEKRVEITILCERGYLSYNPFIYPELTICSKNSIKREHFNEKDNLSHVIQSFYEVSCGKAESNLDRVVSITKILDNNNTIARENGGRC